MATSVETAVEKAKPQSVQQLMTGEQAKKFIAPFLPKDVDLERVAASVLLAIRKDETGTLRKCTAESLVLGVAQIHRWGLELEPGRAYLLPFKNSKKSKATGVDVYEAVPTADYKALCELMIQSKCVRYVEARTVREGDEFSYHFGLDAKLHHVPFGDPKRSAKAITHVYCIIHLPFGASAFEVMTAAEVEAIRQNYSKTNKEGALKDWYARKTIIRQVAKQLPKNPALAKFFSVLEAERELEKSDEFPAPDDLPVAQRVSAGAQDIGAGQAGNEDDETLG